MPKIEDINDTFTMLFGEGVDVSPSSDSRETHYVGIFVNDEDQPVAAISCDLQFAAYAGSALSMIPVGGAEDAIAENSPSETMTANLQEVMNICSRWFMNSDSPHLRLIAVQTTDEISADVQTVVAADKHLEFNVEIPNYGQGHFHCFST